MSYPGYLCPRHRVRCGGECRVRQCGLHSRHRVLSHRSTRSSVCLLFFPPFLSAPRRSLRLSQLSLLAFPPAFPPRVSAHGLQTRLSSLVRTLLRSIRGDVGVGVVRRFSGYIYPSVPLSNVRFTLSPLILELFPPNLEALRKVVVSLREHGDPTKILRFF